MMLHPLLVHFPIGLIGSAALCDLASLACGRRATPRHIATGLYLAGAAALVAAYFTGRGDAVLVRIPGPAHALVDQHWTWALRATLYVSAFALARLAAELSGQIVTRRRRVAVVAAGLAGLLLLFQTAERGGRLVYQYGVGVAAPR